MQTSTPVSHIPSTPSRSYYSTCSHQPLNSSPLASPMMFSSPTTAAQARRRSHYKSAAPRFSHRTPDSPAKRFFSRTKDLNSEDPQKSFLRERLQARCRESAQRQRERAVFLSRSSGFSDEFMDCEEDESDDVVMQDELFRKIIQSANHKKRHAFRLSYSLEVGSSFDPDLEDATTWEIELRRDDHATICGVDEPPDELEEEELLAYAEQCAILADLAELNVSGDDFSTWSDVEDTPSASSQGSSKEENTCMDHDMDVS
ncbi:hypothetical protein F5I97DRAFT_1931698 [Phlebopus sp. FC_14]|nr:hypothetical protein F5I97DRAFT_1931698 [Phlebopus sp. FC_14]